MTFSLSLSTYFWIYRKKQTFSLDFSLWFSVKVYSGLPAFRFMCFRMVLSFVMHNILFGIKLQYSFKQKTLCCLLVLSASERYGHLGVELQSMSWISRRFPRHNKTCTLCRGWETKKQKKCREKERETEKERKKDPSPDIDNLGFGLIHLNNTREER